MSNLTDSLNNIRHEAEQTALIAEWAIYDIQAKADKVALEAKVNTALESIETNYQKVHKIATEALAKYGTL